ncbi:energy transducer TonB [Candidatus Fermentibacteria bacterium]|nr:energy transducer TonB [Candidatus Fermentibacteria bacterium]
MRRDPWCSPSHVGVGAAVALHGLLAVLFLLVHVSVRPMAAPPLEVELLAGEISSAEEQPAPQAPPRESTGPRARTGDIAPLPASERNEALLPDLPASSALSDRPPSPLLSPSDPAPPGPSPGARLAPMPVTTSSPAVGSGVKVRVEGTLSTRTPIYMVDPVFPPGAPSGGIVKVRLVVTPDGNVRVATLVLKAHPALDDAAIEALRQWRFESVTGSADATGDVTVEFVLR